MNDDLISRQAVIYYIKGYIHEIITESGEDKNAHTNRVLRALINGVETMPSVNPQEPREGHWISNAIQGEIDGQIVKAFTCSECGAISVFRMADGKIVNGDLCPNCGARMESEEV